MGTVLWSQAFDDAWEATANGESLAHRRSFGWANAYTHDRPGAVSFSFTEQWMRYPAILLQVLLVVGAVLLWRGRVSLRRRARRGSRG
jgi:hypothetical protein